MSAGRPPRWDWIVVLAGLALLCALVVVLPPAGGIAVSLAYLLGRWDEGPGSKYRTRSSADV